MGIDGELTGNDIITFSVNIYSCSVTPSLHGGAVPQLRNFALTPLDIAVRLDRKLELTGNARLRNRGAAPPLSDVAAEQLDRRWELTGNINITFSVNIYSIRFAGSFLRRRRGVL